MLFVHGLGSKREATPYYHRPWLMHLAREGYEVVYPGYETFPYQPGGLKHLIQGVGVAACRTWRRACRSPRSATRAAAGS